MNKHNEQQEPQPRSEAELRQIVRGIVGEVMDAKEQQAALQAKMKPSMWRNRTVVLSFVLGLVIATFILTTVLPRVLSNDVRVIPSDLHGVWSTTDTRYMERSFEIKRDSLVFQTGDNSFTHHAVRRVDIVEEDSTTLFMIDYLNNENLYTFSFYYDSVSGTIRFQNQIEMVWTK